VGDWYVGQAWIDEIDTGSGPQPVVPVDAIVAGNNIVYFRITAYVASGRYSFDCIIEEWSGW
jgi:hypothetical protein